MGSTTALINPLPISVLAVRDDIKIAMPENAIFPARKTIESANRSPWMEMLKKTNAKRKRSIDSTMFIPRRTVIKATKKLDLRIGVAIIRRSNFLLRLSMIP